MKTLCLCQSNVSPWAGEAYSWSVPKLWTDTIDAHRRAVHDAILDTTATLAMKNGLSSVTMSKIAQKVGIGRATLYKYFSDVESIMRAWHERQVEGHLGQLAEVRDQARDAGTKLEAVLEAYALIAHEKHDVELAALLHRGDHFVRAQHRLQKLVRDLIAEGATRGDYRDDVPADELASYCLHALTAAGTLSSKTAVHRLVSITVAALQRPTRRGHARAPR